MDRDVLRFRPPQFMDLQEFIDCGFMQEANRMFFHVLGLEIVAEVRDEGGLELRVWDGRALEEGVAFQKREDEWSEVCRHRAGEVVALWEKAAAKRRGRFGFVVQPIDKL